MFLRMVNKDCMWVLVRRSLDHMLVHHLKRSYHVHTPLKRICGTVVDAHTVECVEKLVLLADAGKGTDDMLQRLERLLRVFLPNERIMRRLSLMQQSHEGSGNAQEFCILCVYMVAMEILMSERILPAFPRVASCTLEHTSLGKDVLQIRRSKSLHAF